jgi:tetratricopeptide (TPR) repeat protein
MSGVIVGRKPLLLGLFAACLTGAASVAVAQQEETEFDCSQTGHLWEDATEEELRDPKLHFRSTKLYFSQGAEHPELFIKAAREAELAVHLDPTEPEYYMRLGMAYAELRCWDAAGEAFAKARMIVAGDEKKKKLADDIENNTRYYWQDRFLLGLDRIEEANFEEAVSAFESAIAIDSTEAKAYSNLGVAYHSLERYGDAIEAFEYALARDSTDSNAKRAYRSTKAMVAQNTFSEGLTSAADPEAAKEKLAEAIAMYEEVLEQDPPDSEIADYQGMMAEAWRALGQTESDEEASHRYHMRSVEHYRKSALARYRDAAANGETPPTLETDGTLLEQILGSFVMAAEWDSTMLYGQQLIDLDPRNHTAYRYLGLALRQTGEQDKALTYLLVSQCLDPEQSEAVADINTHFVGLLNRYQPTDDIVTASIQNLESPDEIRMSTSGADVSEAWFFWSKGYVDCYYNGQSAGRVDFSPSAAEAGQLSGEAVGG